MTNKSGFLATAIFRPKIREKYIPFYGERGKMSFGHFYVLITLFLFILKGVTPMAKLERNFQSHLIKRLKLMFEGCIVMKTDPDYIQGIPDLLILFNDKWAALEVKRSNTAHKQPNQEYYVRLMDDMSFSRFICPENEEEVLYELQQTFFGRR